jgi:hypothetical protein
MRGTWLMLTILAISAPLAQADWWYTYEASQGTFPEQQAWNRWTDGGGAQRSFEDGAVVLDASASPGIMDFYGRGMPSLPDPNDPTRAFVCEWTLCVTSVDGWLNPNIGIMFAGYGDVFLGYETGQIYSYHETKYVADFEPGVFHTYRLATRDMQTYTLAVDGAAPYAGNVSPWAPSSGVTFGDNGTNCGSISRWQYVRYGVVSVLAADTNCDGTVDFADINPFVGALTAPADMPACGVMNADINQDGVVDFGDINPFVDLILQVR